MVTPSHTPMPPSEFEQNDGETENTFLDIVISEKTQTVMPSMKTEYVQISKEMFYKFYRHVKHKWCIVCFARHIFDREKL